MMRRVIAALHLWSWRRAPLEQTSTASRDRRLHGKARIRARRAGSL